MEYNRYVDFFNNPNTYNFHTYLSVQLDATCNGFIHMALLSNQETLFKQLNLTTNSKLKEPIVSDSEPSDLYNFLLHKLITFFKKRIDEGIVEYPKSKGSYVRLYNFI